jgi:predicted cupin superfamily sugar epimerase
MNKIIEIVESLGLTPHPEGGYFREIYRSGEVCLRGTEERSVGTAIYFLLPGDTFSAFHKVRGSDEVWHYYAGAPLELYLIGSSGTYERKLLGSSIPEELPVHIVPSSTLQAARSLGEWTLAGCTVHPGFDFQDFEMPARKDLIQEFPELEDLIVQFTREEHPIVEA